MHQAEDSVLIFGVKPCIVAAAAATPATVAPASVAVAVAAALLAEVHGGSSFASSGDGAAAEPGGW